MLIIPYVCAEFHDKAGSVLYRITPAMRGRIEEAPESIKQDILFNMLVADGSIKVPETAAQKKTLEQDPMVGVTAEGKSEQPKAAGNEKPAKAVKAAKVKEEARAEEKPAGDKPAGEEQK